MLSRRDRLRLETTRPSDPRTETILRQLKGMGNGLSAPRKAKKTVVLGLDVNFTKRERERILRERNYLLAFWVIMGHGGKQVSEKSRSELRHVVVEKKKLGASSSIRDSLEEPYLLSTIWMDKRGMMLISC